MVKMGGMKVGMTGRYNAGIMRSGNEGIAAVRSG